MQILMDLVNKQQSQIAELVKSKAGQVSQSLIDEVNDIERLAHHQSQLMNGLAAGHVNCLVHIIYNPGCRNMSKEIRMVSGPPFVAAMHASVSKFQSLD